jgi:hypothetical protein
LEQAVVDARADAGHMVLRGVIGEASLTAPQRTRMALCGLNTAAAVGGRAVVSSLLMANGGSMRTLQMADAAATRIQEVDPILDDIERVRALLGPRVPANPAFTWGFDRARLILVETSSGTVFRFSDVPG